MVASCIVRFVTLVLAAVALTWGGLVSAAGSLVTHASQSGQQTLDQDDGGGNLFAGAFALLNATAGRPANDDATASN
jgi:hypothetical protein